MAFRILEHTGDAAVEGTGPGPGEALAEAATGLASLILGRSDIHRLRPDGELAFTVEAPDLPALAVAFLAEVLWHAESEDRVWLAGGAEVGRTAEGAWQARARGNTLLIDVAAEAGVEVKAVTYHELRFAPTPGGGWRVHAVLDL